MNPTFNPFQYNAPAGPSISPEEAQRRADLIARQNAMKEQSRIINEMNIPSMFQPAPTIEPTSTVDQTPINTSYYDPAAEAMKAQERVQEQQRSGLREGIRNLLTSAGNVYKSLYGGLETMAAGQKGQLEKQYGENVGQIADQFSSELPKIGQAYAARGAYDSTFRTGAEELANQAYGKQLTGLAQEQQSALGKIGSAYQTERAKYGAGETALQSIGSRLGDVTDLGELTSIRNAIESKIGELQTAQAGLGTEAQNIATTQAFAPMTDRFAQASQTIQNIVRGQAPPLLKKQIANQIIVNSNLSEEEQKQLQSIVNQTA